VRDKLQLSKMPFLDLIASWRQLSQEIADFFRDPAQTEFILVTIPEALGVYQARRLVGEFAQFGLAIQHLIVTREYSALMQITHLPLFADEVKGVERLRRVEALLFTAQP